MELETGWPCNGPLLRLAEKVARKLLPGKIKYSGPNLLIKKNNLM